MRLHDWIKRFEAEHCYRSAMPHQWGSHDCCLGPCALIEAVTGQNPAKPVNIYETRSQAIEIIKSFGGFYKMFERLAHIAGYSKIEPGLAQRADLVLVKLGGIFSHREEEGFTQGLAPGVIGLDGRRVVMVGSVGWQLCNRNMAVKAWGV